MDTCVQVVVLFIREVHSKGWVKILMPSVSKSVIPFLGWEDDFLDYSDHPRFTCETFLMVHLTLQKPPSTGQASTVHDLKVAKLVRSLLAFTTFGASKRSLLLNDTVDGRNPKQPPGMYLGCIKTL